MPKVIKVVGSKSLLSMDVIMEDGNVYPYSYHKDTSFVVEGIESGRLRPQGYDLDNVEHMEVHMSVLNAEDAEVLYEA